MYVLDTNMLIAIVKGNDNVLHKFNSFDRDIKFCTTIINIAELYYGAYHSEKQEANLKTVKRIQSAFRVLRLTNAAVIEYGIVKSALRKTGSLVADNDLFIASITKSYEGILVTDNTKHFERIPGLLVENWLRSD